MERRGLGLYEPLEHVHGGVKVTFTIAIEDLALHNKFQTTVRDGHRESMAGIFLHCLMRKEE